MDTPWYLKTDVITTKILPKFGIINGKAEQVKMKNTDKERSVYKITSDNKYYCLKKVYYPLKDLLFIYSAMEWLYRHKINVPKLLPNIDNKRYVIFKNHIFILTPWVIGSKANYDIENEVKGGARTLGKIHKVSKNFYSISSSNIKIGYNNIHNTQVKHFENLIKSYYDSSKRDDIFSKIYTENFNEIFELAKTSTDVGHMINFGNLTKTLCHGDFVAKNLIIDKEKQVWVIDFDKTKLDYAVSDLAYALRRYLRRSSINWNMDKFLLYLDNYESSYNLNKDEYLYLLSYLSFPQKVWRIAKDYYKINPINIDPYSRILKKNLEDINMQIDFSYRLQSYIDNRFY